jgi:hypothetical protein
MNPIGTDIVDAAANAGDFASVVEALQNSELAVAKVITPRDLRGTGGASDAPAANDSGFTPR